MLQLIVRVLVSFLGYLGHACVFEVEIYLVLEVLVFVTQVLNVEVRLVEQCCESVAVPCQLWLFIPISYLRLNLDYLLVLHLKLVLKPMCHLETRFKLGLLLLESFRQVLNCRLSISQIALSVF